MLIFELQVLNKTKCLSSFLKAPLFQEAFLVFSLIFRKLKKK